MPRGNAKTKEKEQEKATAIVAQEEGGALRTNPLLPSGNELATMWRMAKAFAASGLMPKGMEAPERLLVAIEYGLEVGLKPFQAVQSVAVINGRPGVYGDAALALVLASPVCEYVHEEEIRDEGGKLIGWRCRAKRAGKQEVIRTFTVDDAKTAGLWGKGGPWSQYPSRMLQMRARGFALRDAFPDVLKGVYLVEELMTEAAPQTVQLPPVQEALTELKAQLQETEPNPVDEQPLEPIEPDDDDIATMEEAGLFPEGEDDDKA